MKNVTSESSNTIAKTAIKSHWSSTELRRNHSISNAEIPISKSNPAA